ncbi:MAG: 30S ribosomal protein S20 [Acidobacteria bacterium]|nr:30S ribosomal protein S20 [Acidobacteriota bacterium]
MANHASALKADRKNRRRRMTNRSNRSNLRTFLRKFNEQLQSGKAEDARNSLPALYSEIDTAKRKKALSENAAARQKSRLTRSLNTALSSGEKA